MVGVYLQRRETLIQAIFERVLVPRPLCWGHIGDEMWELAVMRTCVCVLAGDGG